MVPWVCCFDTAGFFNGCFESKPKDKDDAVRMLLDRSGSHHIVRTACALGRKKKGFNEVILRVFTSKVYFRKLDLKCIEEYLEMDQPYNVAGAYKIQANGLSIIKSIKGDYHNIVGMPLGFLPYIRKAIMDS